MINPIVVTRSPMSLSNAITSKVSPSGRVRLPTESAQLKKWSLAEIKMQLNIITAFTIKNFVAPNLLDNQ